MELPRDDTQRHVFSIFSLFLGPSLICRPPSNEGKPYIAFPHAQETKFVGVRPLTALREGQKSP